MKIPSFSFIKKHELIVTVLSVLVLIGAAASYYFYTQYKNTQNILKNPNLAQETQVKDLIGKVGKLMELPNEQPTIATVVDASKLKDQPFFANAKNGFKVFIYTGVKKAILYDPVENKIVDVAPINIGDQNTPTPAVAAPSVTVVQPRPTTVPTIVLSPTPLH